MEDEFEGVEADVGADVRADVEADVELADDVSVGVDVKGDVVVIEGAEVGGGVAVGLPVVVDGGGVRPPNVQTPSVPKGICKGEVISTLEDRPRTF